MSRKSPLNELSRRVAGAVENSPEVEAFVARREVVPNTWGGYATRAIDLELCEPTVEAVTSLLGGPDVVDLRDPEIVFEDDSVFHMYKHGFLNNRRKVYELDLLAEQRRLKRTAGLVLSQWQIDPIEGAAQADAIQKLIDANNGDDDYDETDLLCMKRDGLSDGVNVNLADFVSEMLQVNLLDCEAPSELAGAWVEGVRETVQEIVYDYSYIDLEQHPASDLPLSMKHIGAFLSVLDRGHVRPAAEKSQLDWEYIEPVFLTPESLSVLDGTEK